MLRESKNYDAGKSNADNVGEELKTFTIGIFGDTDSGKKSLILKFVDGEFYEDEDKEQIKNSVLPVSSKILKHDGKIAHRIRLIDHQYNSNISNIEFRYDACLLIFDPTNNNEEVNSSSDSHQRFIKLRSLRNSIEKFYSYGKKIPIFVVASKNDKEAVDEIFLEYVEALYDELFFSTSAKTGAGINELFYNIGAKLLKKSGVNLTQSVQILEQHNYNRSFPTTEEKVKESEQELPTLPQPSAPQDTIDLVGNEPLPGFNPEHDLNLPSDPIPTPKPTAPQITIGFFVNNPTPSSDPEAHDTNPSPLTNAEQDPSPKSQPAGITNSVMMEYYNAQHKKPSLPYSAEANELVNEQKIAEANCNEEVQSNKI